MELSVRFKAWPCAFVLMFCSPAMAQQSYPMLMSLTPAAAQVGQTSEHTLESRYSMYGASQVLVSGEGVTGEIATEMQPDKDGKEPSLTQIKLKFTVAAEAMPGVRDFRIIGPTGPSTVGQLVIVRDAVVAEDPKNDSQDTAQGIVTPCTLCGCVEKAEDVDFYQFSVTQPVSLSFHCRAMRLEDRIHDLQSHVDPIISIRNASTGSTVASADNFFAADPFLAWSFTPGDYLLEVRDVRYLGNKYWNYVIEISDRPFVSQVYPSIVAVGATSELQLIGQNLNQQTPVSWTAPMDMPQVCGGSYCTLDVSLPVAGQNLNPVPVVVTKLPVVSETDGDNAAPATAQAISFPSAVSGRIEADSDIDCFSFEAKKDERISVEVIARRNGSALDSIIRILNAEGNPLQENDDLRLWGRRTIQDSMIENWQVPADGRYTIEIRDVHLRGGTDFVYGVEVTRAVPQFDLILDTDKTWLTPGSCAAIFVRASRRNGFDGEIQLDVAGLPEGVTASCGRILPGPAVDGCIILEAASDAKQVASNIRVRGTAVVPQGEGQEPLSLTSISQSMQETYMPGGGRSHFPVELHTVGIGLPSDIRDVRLSTYQIQLQPGESAKIDVELVRAEGFDKNVTLDMLFQHLSSVFANTLPAGVTIDAKNSQTLLTGTNSKGVITLTAAKDAKPVEAQQSCVMANVSINFVMKATYSSRPVMISVAAP